MSNIVVGDNGPVVVMNVIDAKGKVPLATATSIVVRFIRSDQTIFDKVLSIIDAPEGKCSLEILSADVTVSGNYQYQLAATFSNGNIFRSELQEITISRKI